MNEITEKRGIIQDLPEPVLYIDENGDWAAETQGIRWIDKDHPELEKASIGQAMVWSHGATILVPNNPLV